ncbi:pair-rule protein odd-paired-like [Orussus abietinus]|uniref:pair-rule protein odd-paired-like n=1 Tax=Orussus abietinus TaxID=222816 RepID=UPI000C715EE6|nr:pair-rule protein odd-paired-like [Orussus abietinus]
MPPVLGGAAMAVLPASPQTATQGTPHPHPQAQTQVLPSAGAGQAQPQLLYQPYNLVNAPGPAPAGSPAQPGHFHHLHHNHHHHHALHQPTHHQHQILHHPAAQQSFLPDAPSATAQPLERREAEVRELEKREREAKMERERLEKQRAAEQAVHKHFEESLRLAQQKVSLVYCALPVTGNAPPFIRVSLFFFLRPG